MSHFDFLAITSLFGLSFLLKDFHLPKIVSDLRVRLNKWQNASRRPKNEHIFMKQKFLGNFSPASLKKFPPCNYGHNFSC